MTRRLALLVLLALFLRPAPAAACKCQRPSPASAVRNADAVFWGEVTAVTEHATRAEITVTVRGVWKGSVGATVTVYSTNTSCTILNIGLDPGERWIFAAREKGGAFHVRQCDGTRPATAKARAAYDRVAGAAATP